MQAIEQDRSRGRKRTNWGQLIPGLIGLAVVVFLALEFLLGGAHLGVAP